MTSELPSPITPDSVAAWVHELPYGNLAQLGSHTSTLLEHLQSVALSASDRNAINRSLERPVKVVLAHLEQLLTTEHAEAEQLAALGIQICDQMSQSCQTARAASVGYGGAQRAAIAGVMGLAFLNRALLFGATVYRAPDVWLWERAGQLFRSFEAEPAKLQNAMLKIIAFWTADTRSLSPRMMVELANGLAALNLVPMIGKGRRSRAAGHSVEFYFAAGTGAPPGIGQAPKDVEPLDFAGLCRQIKRQRLFSADLTEHLVGRWSVNTKPKKGRRLTCDTLIQRDAVIGFAAIHRSLREAMGLSDKSKTAFGQPGDYRQSVNQVSTEVLDLGEGGCRLRFSASSPVRVNDVMALTWLKGDQRVGVIVWMQQVGANIECGLKWVLKEPIPIDVMFDTNRPLPALRGTPVASARVQGNPTADETWLLYITPAGRFRSSAWVHERGGWHRYALAVTEQNPLIEVAQAVAVGGQRPAQPATDERKPEDNAWQLLTPYAGTAAVAPCSAAESK